MVKKKILYPADDELKQLLEQSFLHRDTFEFVAAQDGHEALRLIEDEDPVLAILDLDMPGLSGADCCREVKRDPLLSTTPLALVATSSSPNSLSRCQSAGCDAILTKPIDKRQLLATLCLLLDIQLRSEPRIEVDFKVQLRHGKERRHEGQALDLNHGGLFITTDWLQPAGTLLKLELFPGEDTTPLCCDIEVVWVNHHEWVKAHRLPVGMGIKFSAPDDDFCTSIEEIYTRHSND